MTHSGLEKALADLLLPPDGFGHRSNSSGKSGSHGGQETSHSGRSPVLKITDTSYRGDLIDIDFDFHTGKGEKNILVELQVVTESGSISANQWEKPSTIGTKFPLKLTEFTLTPTGKTTTVSADEGGKNLPVSNLPLKFEVTEVYGVPYGVTISHMSEENINMNGRITFWRSSRDISGAVSITQKGDR